MAKKLQLRRGTTSQHSSFTGAVGEVTVDTDKDVIVVHDGSTAGGHASVKSGAIATADLAADCVDGTKIADDSINSEHYVAASIDNEHLADDAVGVAELSATGTASSSTFLRGDNAWAVVDTTNASNLSTGTLPIARIADDAITNAKMADDAIDSAQIADGSVDNVHLAGSIATSKLTGAVTSIASHGLATSATTDTTSASNISSGTLNTARLPATIEITTVDWGAWTAVESGGVLYFKHNGTNKMKLDSSGNFTVTGNVTAYGSV